MRELRTLLVKLKGVPLTAGVINDFEGVLKDCALKYNHSLPSVDPLEYETHYDPNLVMIVLVSESKPSLSFSLSFLFPCSLSSL